MFSGPFPLHPSLSLFIKVHLIEYDDETNNLHSTAIYPHAAQVLSIHEAPKESMNQYFFTRAPQAASPSMIDTTLWKLPESAATSSELEQICTLPLPNTLSLCWSPHDSSVAALCADGTLSLFDLQHEQRRAQHHSSTGANRYLTKTLPPAQEPQTSRGLASLPSRHVLSALNLTTSRSVHSALSQLASSGAPEQQPALDPESIIADHGHVSWDPHRPTMIAVVADKRLSIYDHRTRSAILTMNGNGLSIPAGDEVFGATDSIRCCDWNPNKPNLLAVSGDDRSIRLFDLRRVAAQQSGEVLRLWNHSHFVWTVQFNPWHDQLVLSAGTEMINVWKAISCSSAALGQLESMFVPFCKSFCVTLKCLILLASLKTQRRQRSSDQVLLGSSHRIDLWSLLVIEIGVAIRFALLGWSRHGQSHPNG